MSGPPFFCSFIGCIMAVYGHFLTTSWPFFLFLDILCVSCLDIFNSSNHLKSVFVIFSFFMSGPPYFCSFIGSIIAIFWPCLGNFFATLIVWGFHFCLFNCSKLWVGKVFFFLSFFAQIFASFKLWIFIGTLFAQGMVSF